MYYRMNSNNSGLGLLTIWAEGIKKEIDVPFFNVSDLIEFSKNQTA